MKNTKMEKRSELDIVRVSLWYWYIRVNLSKNSDYQIEKVIEPNAFNKNKHGDAYHNNKWRGYRLGKHTPSPILIGQAESHVQGSSMLLKHTLWQVMNNSISIESLLSDELRNLSWEVQRILYKANKYDYGSALVTHLSKRKLRQLECLAGLDALAAQIIFFKLAVQREEDTSALSQSIYRTLLIICTELPFFNYREHFISLVNWNVFSLVSSTKEVLGKSAVYNFSKNVRILISLLLAMEDKGIVGITRKESIKALSDLLDEKQVLTLFEGVNILTTDAI
ncbi:MULTISPECIES: hypothetical protein [Acinetobacter]|uniref:Uncharacterized protein n=3 Tax=Acinetobacter ursingii TaxID=108980 RepID=A0A7T9UFT4_9GAMM|nr:MULTISPECIES: hypothetical protein [Acinetobacter]ENX46808.1 hypothetical protein F943_03152 [Acinetobacter ursingii NIPH 706]QQT85081.1 hypothetical protein I6I53_08925 [Acinetobacter ursingii]RSO83814.1 hypothetical protein EA748_05760 [Acinetobacter ursingii]